MKSEVAKRTKVDYNEFRKTHCRYCDSTLKAPFLDLGLSPLANSLPRASEFKKDEFLCPLSLVKCDTCHLVQLTHVVPADMMFSHYLYVSSTTATFQKHFAEYARDVKEKLNLKQALAVDIGSNDGLLVSCFAQQGMQAVGIEPAKNLSDAANQAGRETINSYFNEDSVRQILKKYGPAHAITANNVFAHIDNVQDVLRNVNQLLADNGIFVIEFPYLPVMLKEMLYDMIYHEHLSYIALHPLQFFLARFQMKLFDVKPVASHGGSLRVYIEKNKGPYPVQEIVGRLLNEEAKAGLQKESSYDAFTARVKEVKQQIRDYVQQIKKSGKTISGYGAPAKATTLINHCELTASEIDYVVDDNPLKQNMLVPGVKIPIVSSAHLQQNPTDYVLIFAWNFAEEIIEKISYLRKQNTQFIIPLPKPRIV